MKGTVTLENGNTFNIEIEENELVKFIPKPRRWIPSLGEEFWYISAKGSIIQDKYFSSIHRFILDSGNCYKTKADAKAALVLQEAKNRIENYLNSHPELWFEPDWHNTKQKKYFPYFGEGRKLLVTYNVTACYLYPNYYFKSEADCKKFIKDNEIDLRVAFDQVIVKR